jgi:predicted NBD/HSP70 family sugar kinase
VRQLVDNHLVLETGQSRGKRGLPSTQLEVNADGAFATGIDFDKDHLTSVLVDFCGNVRQRIHFDLDFPEVEEGLALMEEVTRTLIAQEGLAKESIVGVGVGFPGPLQINKERPGDNVVNPYFFPGWQNVPIVDRLERRLNLPVTLENNATAAALGERWYGAGQRLSHFFYVYFGIGLGGGVILNDQVYSGLRGNAGELGYLPVQLPDGQTFLGDLFRLTKLYAVLRTHGKHVTTPAELEQLYHAQDEHLLAWLERFSEHLAGALIAIEHLLDPEAIVLGGRLPEGLLRGLFDRLEAIMPTLRREGKGYPSKLLHAQAGEDAAALGLATLPIYESVAPRPSVLLKERVHKARLGPASWLTGR